MQTIDSWEKFLKTGSVYDYLSYRQNEMEREQEQSEIHDRRSCDKRE